MNDRLVPLEVLQALGTAIGRSTGSFDTAVGIHALIDHSEDGTVRAYEGWVLPKFQAWELWDPAHSERRRYNPLDGLLVEHVANREEYAAIPPRKYSVPDPLRMLIPGELPIWGRSRDAWRIVDADGADGSLRLHLLGMKDENETAEVSLDPRGWAKRYETPWSTTVVTNVEESDAIATVWWGVRSEGL